MADTVGAEGAHPFGWNGQPPTVAGYTPAGTNVVQHPDVKSIAADQPNDSDTDDPYPGGPTKGMPILPLT